MEIIKEANDFYQLKDELWSGALDTMQIIEDNDKQNELMTLLEDVFYEATDLTKVNDYLWFDRDDILEQLDINEEDDEEEDEDEQSPLLINLFSGILGCFTSYSIILLYSGVRSSVVLKWSFIYITDELKKNEAL